MKTLLQINTEVNYGSTGRIAEAIGTIAIEHGWKSYIAFGRKKRKSSSLTIRIGNKLDNYIHVFLTRMFDAHGKGSKRATRNLIAQIEAIGPDIIHMHNLHGYYLNLSVFFTYLAEKKIPVVWTFHDCWPLTGHCTHFEHIGCTKWQKHCNTCPQLASYPSSLFWDGSKRNHTLKKRLFTQLENLTLVAVSHWLEKMVQKSFLHTFPTKTISNGVAVDVFSPRSQETIRNRYHLNDQFVILGVASVWSTNKGLDDFLKLSTHIDTDITIVLIGLSENQRKALPKNIIGISRTDSVAELAEWYSTADVYVNTSVEESFGMTNAEAMACGTPVIVYNATALPEMVTPDVGFVITKRDVLEMKSCIDQLKINGKKAYTNACLDRAKTLYDQKTNFEAYMTLYNSLITDCKIYKSSLS